MTDQPDEGSQSSTPPDPTSPLDFDPYRYGKPDHPVPPEYAPPGYVPPPTQPPTGQPQPVWPPTETNQAPPQYGTYPQPGNFPGQLRSTATRRTRHRRRATPPTAWCSRPTARRRQRMVLGIASIVLCFLSVLDLGLAVPAIVLGALGMRDAKRFPQRGGHGRALAGVICGSIGLLLVIIVLIVVIARIAPCIHSGCSGVSQSCVNDHL